MAVNVKKFPFKQSSGRPCIATWFTDDNSTTCNCAKWLRNVEPDGSRICEHTKEIKRLHPEVKARTDRSKPHNVSISVPANTPITVQATAGTKVTVTTNHNQPTGTNRRFDWGES